MTKQFVIHALLFLIIGWIGLHLLAFVSNHYAPSSSTTFLKADQERWQQFGKGPQPDLIVLGNSHAASIQWDAYQDTVYQWSRPGGDLYETAYYARALAQRSDTIQTIFIEVSFFSFGRNNTQAVDTKIRRIHTYQTVPEWYWADGDFFSFVQGKSEPLLPFSAVMRFDNWRNVFYAAIGRSPKQEDATDCTPPSLAELNEHGQNRATYQFALNQEMAPTDLLRAKTTQQNYQLLNDLTHDLQAQNITVIFFTAPYWSGYTEQYIKQDPIGYQQMQTYMQQLQQTHAVAYYDFSQDQTLSMDITLFANSDHLNNCGKQIFSRYFATRLAQS